LTTTQKEVKFFGAVNQPSRVAITFGPFSLDASATQLLREGAEVRLRPQALRVLKVLLLHSAEWVRYEQMIAEAWDGTLVSQHTIDVTVGEVKRSLAEYGKWISNRPKVGYSLEVPRSDELVRRGWHFWNQRTRAGLEHAIDCFERAAVDCPSDFRAFEGLSSSYLTLVTFGIKSPAEMHARFVEAHKGAEALCGLTPDLRCNWAHGLHIFERKTAEAESQLLKAIEQKPTLAAAHIRLALVYGSQERIDEAVQMVERAQAADPLWPVVSLMSMIVRFWRRQFDEAVVVGRNAVALHPAQQAVRSAYAEALEFTGRSDEALVQYQIATSPQPDLLWIRALEGACLARLNRGDEALAVLDQLERLRATDYVDAYHMALLRRALGQVDQAFAELDRAFEEKSAWLYALSVDARLDPLRSDPRFARLRDRLFVSYDAQRTA
jgi:DNA-binding winged helix-turn-helix (wHTH) protein/Flp pilus assembly protein TadD